jgi:hypothetical protein
LKKSCNLFAIAAFALTIALSLGPLSPASAGDRLRDRIGGGNLVTHLAGKPQMTQL